MGNRKLKQSKRTMFQYSVDSHLTFLRNCILDMRDMMKHYPLENVMNIESLNIQKSKDFIKCNQKTIQQVYDALLSNVKIYYDKKQVFLTNLKKLNIECIQVNNNLPKIFKKGDETIEVGFILEFERVDDIFIFINHTHNIGFIDMDDYVDIVFNNLYKVIINTDYSFIIRKMDGSFIHLKNMINEPTNELECNICFQEVHEHNNEIIGCKICSFQYCKTCLNKLSKCASCMVEF